jgi:hypothetical protein
MFNRSFVVRRGPSGQVLRLEGGYVECVLCGGFMIGMFFNHYILVLLTIIELIQSGTIPG